MGLIDIIKSKFSNVSSGTAFKMVQDNGDSFVTWDGRVFDNDVVRSCIRPFAKSVGKLMPIHTRDDHGTVYVNPDPYMKILLRDPNPYMSMNQMLEKVSTTLLLNGNAFVLIVRDDNGIPSQLYPIPATTCETQYDDRGGLSLKFTMLNGTTNTFPYSEVIHLRNDFNGNDIFGTSPFESLSPLVHVISSTDKGIVKMLKNNGIIKWLMKYNIPMRPEDVKRNTEEFVNNYLDSNNSGLGVAAIDTKADLTQITQKDYVPGTDLIGTTIKRIYGFFNTNEHIVQSSYDEDEWTTYFDSVIEPFAIQLSQEFSRKLFTRRERSFGNEIVFQASSLGCSSFKTKLNLVGLVDRGALTINEWRSVLGLPPVENGDILIRRLDTQQVAEEGGTDDEDD